MLALRSRTVVVRLAWTDVDRRSLADLGPGVPALPERFRLLCAHPPAQRPVPVLAVDPVGHVACFVGRGTRAVADSLMPTMRPASLGLALLLAAGSLAYPPLAVAATVYAGLRFVQREMRRRNLHCDLESQLRLALLQGDLVPG